jgi:hypothetical protein
VQPLRFLQPVLSFLAEQVSQSALFIENNENKFCALENDFGKTKTKNQKH